MRRLQRSIFVSSLLFAMGALPSLVNEAHAAQERGFGAFSVVGQGLGFIDLEISSGKLSLQASNHDSFVQVHLDGQTGMTGVVGAPSLPVLSSLLQLPSKGELKIEILRAETERIPTSRVIPTQGGKTRCHAEQPPFAIQEKFYEPGAVFPQDIAKISTPMVLRGVPCARIEVQPVRYDAAAQELLVTKKLRLRVHVSADKADVTRKAASHHRPVASLDRYMLTLPKARNISDLRAKPNQTMLIVLGKEEYRKPIEKLARWKERRGLNVVIKTTKEIGGNTVESIKKATQELYDDSKVDLAYLLLVGDKDVKTPTVKITSPGQMDSDGMGEADYRYSLLDGDDLVGDISVGRFSVVDQDQVQNQVDKVLYYEQAMGQDGDDADLSWIESAIGVASSEKSSGPSDTQRMQKIIKSFKGSGYKNLEEFYQAASPQPSKLLDSINKGRGFISYMGHGNGSAWVFKSGFRFSTSHVEKVENNKQWPIVMDCACTNGDFWNREPSFSEIWQRGGSHSEAFGALGIVSSTIIAAWDPPAVMAEEMFAQVLKEPSLTLGGMMTSGLLKMAETFPGSGSMKLTRDTFVLFGDPSLKVRAFVPQATSIETVEEDSRKGTMTFKVERKDPKEGKVAAYPAIVALSLDGELIVSASTDKDGKVKLQIPDSVDAQELEIVVTGHRLVAYEGTIKRSAPTEESQSDSEKGKKKKKKGSDDEGSESDDQSSDDDEEKSGKKKKRKKKKSGCAVDDQTMGWLGFLGLMGMLGWSRRRRG